jgi:hypothetical protein
LTVNDMMIVLKNTIIVVVFNHVHKVILVAMVYIK